MTRARDVADSALVHIATETFSSASSVSLNNVFTSDYANYRIVLNIDTISSSNFSEIRLRASGTDYSGNLYRWAYDGRDSDNNAHTGYSGAATTFILNYTATSRTSFGTFDITNPQAAKITHLRGITIRDQNAGLAQYLSVGGSLINTSQYDGLTLVSASNMTGIISVYGYRD